VSDSLSATEPAVDVEAVRAAVIETLGIEDRADAVGATTSLMSTPELDSMAVLELVVELERRFGITIDDEDVTTELFETVGSLAALVNAKLR
jgi:acyl carrier protein